MRIIPLLHADFVHGSYTKVAKALRKVWPPGGLSLMQSQDSLAVLLGYNGHFDARQQATESFVHTAGTIGPADVQSAVVRSLFLDFGIDPVVGRALVPRLHLGELAIFRDARTDEALAAALRAIDDVLASGADGVSNRGAQTGVRLFYDEAGVLLDGMSKDDLLKERLRSVDGIPNAAYEVRGDRVFVFEKLLRSVQALGMRADEPALADLALRLLDGSTVSPEEAVNRWKIVPEPYEVEILATGGVEIRHRPFNARVPGVYATITEALPALVKLLMGAVVPGQGEFDYKAQPMSLCDPLDLSMFTMAPPVGMPAAASTGQGWRQWVFGPSTGWLDGFAPLPESRFTVLADACEKWDAFCSFMSEHVTGSSALIWSRAGELGLSMLNDPSETVDDTFGQRIEGLRRCYPELTMLSDGTLYWQHSAFEDDRWDSGSAEARRDDEFIAYLVGFLVDESLDAEHTTYVGKWALYHWLAGNTLEEAKCFARQVEFNRLQANRLSQRLSDAMRYLQAASYNQLRGREISTFGDMFRRYRKTNTVPLVVHQRWPASSDKRGRNRQ